MRAVVELNGYAEGTGDQLRFRPIDDGLRVGSFPATVVVRAVWRTEPGDDDLPGYMPFARLVLAHAEPGAQEVTTPAPDLFHVPLERWDGASIIFAAYTLRFERPGDHRLVFPRAGLADMTLRVRLDG